MDITKDGTLIGVILTQLAIIGIMVAYWIKKSWKDKEQTPEGKKLEEAQNLMVKTAQENAQAYVKMYERTIEVVTANNILVENNTESNQELMRAFASLREAVLTNIIRSTQ